MPRDQLSFLDYFEELDGEGMYFDMKTRVIKIFGNGGVLSTLYLAKRVPFDFKLIDALRKLKKVGDVAYYVYEDDENKEKIWLYPLTLATIL